MAARKADGLRIRPKVGALKSGCGWLAERYFYRGGGRSRGHRGWPGWVEPGGALPGRSPPARPARPPAPGQDESEPGPLVAPTQRGVSRVGRVVVVSAQFQGWRPRRVESNCAVVGGRAPGGIDKGRGQEGVRRRSGRGRREKETEMERSKEKNTQRDRGGERDTRREM